MGQTPGARRLAQPSKKRERKPNSRYDQEAIAYAEADEEDEEEEVAEEEDEEEEVAEATEDASGHDAAGRKHLDDDDDEVSYDEKTGISAEVRVQVTCGDLRGTIVLPAGYKKQQESGHLSRRQEGSPVAVRTRRREGFEQELEDQRLRGDARRQRGSRVQDLDGIKRVLSQGYAVG